MNQLDIWKGGQQINRGYKYLDIHKQVKEDNNEVSQSHIKLVCVVCNDIQFKSTQNKAYKLFEIGFTKNTLCYLKNLQHIIHAFF